MRKFLVAAAAAALLVVSFALCGCGSLGLGAPPDPALVAADQTIVQALDADTLAHPEHAAKNETAKKALSGAVDPKSVPPAPAAGDPAWYAQVLAILAAAQAAGAGSGTPVGLTVAAGAGVAAFLITNGKSLYRLIKGQPSAGELKATTAAVDQHAKLIDSVTTDAADSAAKVVDAAP